MAFNWCSYIPRLYFSYMCCSCCNFSPWDGAPYKDAAERTARGDISLNAFLSQVFMTSVLCFLHLPCVVISISFMFYIDDIQWCIWYMVTFWCNVSILASYQYV